jgi:peroxiredoxin Q/BCP
MKLKIGDKAPDFKLKDQTGKEHSLASYSGKSVLLYFYPKDDTPGCTKEACEIRDNFSVFKKLKLVIIGVSADSVNSHKKFSEKYNLPFILLADENKKVVKIYGAWERKKFMGREYYGIKRISFLIDPKGNIEKIYENVVPANHAKEVISDIDK